MGNPPPLPPSEEPSQEHGLDEQPGDGPATRELIAARKRRLAAQAETPAQGSNVSRERRRHDAYWLDE